MHTHYNTLAGEEVGRIAALSDGIFAIAARILVLDFHTPEPADIHSEAELLRALAASAPRLLPWVLSSLTLGIFWLGQQTSSASLSVRIATSHGCIFFFSRSSRCCRSQPGSWPISSTYRTAFLVYWVNIVVLGACLYATWVRIPPERAKLIEK